MKTISSEEKMQNQRIVLACLVILIFLSVVLSAISMIVYTNSNSSSTEFTFESKINPNSAAQASLTRLPGIGRAKAKEIISYRENFTAGGGSGPAFKTVNDLDKVTGIGPATINNIYSHLKFD